MSDGDVDIVNGVGMGTVTVGMGGDGNSVFYHVTS